ncbi:MAG TPA: MG2 domain-containing protein, partial [Vulgatibacter sp.]
MPLRIATEEPAPARRRTFGDDGPEPGPRRTRYVLEAASKLPLDRAVTLVFDRGLLGREGPLGSGAEIRRGYRTHGALRFTTATACLWQEERCPWGPVAIEATNRVELESLRSRLTIEPAVEIDWDGVESRLPMSWERRKDPYVVIPGRFRPGTRYVIRIAAGAVDVHGGKAPSFEATVTTDDREPSIDPGPRLALIESEGDGALPLETVNRERVGVELRRLSLPEMAVALRTWKEPAGSPDRSFELRIDAARNVGRVTPVDVRQVFGAGRKTGMFAASFRVPGESDPYPPRVLGQVTDFAVHAKLGAVSGLVWVTRLSSGEPVGGASISLFDWDGTRRWQGKTDTDGLVALPGLSTLGGEEASGGHDEREWQERFAMVAAEKDGEVGVVASGWDDGLGPWVFGLRQDWEGRRARALGMVFPERGIYRPGETAHLKGLIRYRTLGEIRTPPAATEVALRIIGPKGEALAERTVRASDFGTFDSDFEIPADTALGTFQVRGETTVGGQAVSVEGSFRVEEYRAPQFRVDVSTEGGDLAREARRGHVLARYLFGGAMAEAKVRWSLVRRGEPFQPPGNEGFTFGARTWWWDDERSVASTEVVGSGDGVTGPMGELSVDRGTSLAPGD